MTTTRVNLLMLALVMAATTSLTSAESALTKYNNCFTHCTRCECHLKHPLQPGDPPCLDICSRKCFNKYHPPDTGGEEGSGDDHKPRHSCPGVKKQAWPELDGANALLAKKIIEKEEPSVHAVLVSFCEKQPTEFRCDRVRIRIDLVEQLPYRSVLDIPVVG